MTNSDEVYLFHLWENRNGRVVKWWVAATATDMVTGSSGKTSCEVKRLWMTLHEHPKKWIRINGLCRPSEAAMMIADLRLEAK